MLGDLMRKSEKLLERLLQCLVEELIKDGSIEEFELTPLHSFLTEFSLPAGAYQRIRSELAQKVPSGKERGRLLFPQLFQAIFDRLNPYHHVSEIDEALKRLVSAFSLPENFLREYEEHVYGISDEEDSMLEAQQTAPNPGVMRGTSTQKYSVEDGDDTKTLIITLLGDGIRAEPGVIILSRGEIQMEPIALEVLQTMRGMNAGRRLHRPAYSGQGTLVFRPMQGDLREIPMQNEEWVVNPDFFLACDLDLCLSALTSVKIPSDDFIHPMKITGSGTFVIRGLGRIEILDLNGERLMLHNQAFLARTKGFQHKIQLSKEPGQADQLIHILRGTGKVVVSYC